MTPYFPDAIQSWDVSVLNWIQNNIANPFLDAFFSFITHLGDAGILWIITAVVMLFFKKTRKCGIMMGTALLLGLILGNGIMKNAFARVRPFNLEGEFGSIKTVADLLVPKPGDKSFPSGHTLGSFEAAFVLFGWNKKIGIPVIVLASLIAFSRLYLYLHFPTDVFAGVLLAALNAFLAYVIVNAVYKFIENKKKLKLND
ncbi:MAG: phosphatase PAP2 family protein [Ruminococcaceae bacterium]|nr:phosphatase PAP2 family protein [Oscillospiraceae bacterium]